MVTLAFDQNTIALEDAWLRKDEKVTLCVSEIQNAIKAVWCLVTFKGTFGGDPFQRITPKQKCFIHVITMTMYCFKEASFHASFQPCQDYIKTSSNQKWNVVAPFQFFPELGP